MLIFFVFFVNLIDVYVLLFFVLVIIGIWLFIIFIEWWNSVSFFFVESVGDLFVVFVIINVFELLLIK